MVLRCCSTSTKKGVLCRRRVKSNEVFCKQHSDEYFFFILSINAAQILEDLRKQQKQREEQEQREQNTNT